jgi:5S rRNA maturation endonuclease (ribonuclease M5)
MGQVMVIRKLYIDLSKNQEMDVLIGVDMDQKGEEYSMMLSREFPNAKRITSVRKDQNETLMIKRGLKPLEAFTHSTCNT